MKSRVLPIVNAIGCLALTGLVVSQWRQERVRIQENLQLHSELSLVRDQLATETTRSAALERDISALKESIELSRKSTAESANALVERDKQLSAARESIQTWEAAITARDAKLRELHEELVSTRARLDEAVARLKAAGAR